VKQNKPRQAPGGKGKKGGREGLQRGKRKKAVGEVKRFLKEKKKKLLLFKRKGTICHSEDEKRSENKVKERAGTRTRAKSERGN